MHILFPVPGGPVNMIPLGISYFSSIADKSAPEEGWEESQRVRAFMSSGEAAFEELWLSGREEGSR
jgi:hypothetical protein